MNRNALNFKYLPTIKGIIFFYVFILFTVFLLLGKIDHKFRIRLSFLDADAFYSHISNFIISYDLTAIVAFIWLMQGAPFRFVIWLCLVMAAINLFIESFVSILNTPDIVDAVYGIAGVVFAALSMLLIKKSGLRANTTA